MPWLLRLWLLQWWNKRRQEEKIDSSGGCPILIVIVIGRGKAAQSAAGFFDGATRNLHHAPKGLCPNR